MDRLSMVRSNKIPDKAGFNGILYTAGYGLFGGGGEGVLKFQPGFRNISSCNEVAITWRKFQSVLKFY